MKENLDEEGKFVPGSACLGCPIIIDLAEIYASDDSGWYDVHSRMMTSRMMLESVYSKCPGRNMATRVPGWRKLFIRMFNSEPVGVRMARDETRGKKPGTFYPCGLDK